MIEIRRSNQRGHANHGWLDSYHTFSFADYHDPEQMGFSTLRVINEDRIAAGAGFGTHGHRDMEIITYLLSGALEHKDSMNNGSIMRPGDVQRMSAGKGVQHSEYNASQTEEAYLLQIWILPDVNGISPEYEQTHFPEAERRGRLRIVASGDGREGSLTIHQDANIYAGLLAPGDVVTQTVEAGRHVYLQLARGEIELNGQKMSAGDGAKITKEKQIELKAVTDSEMLLFDLS